MGKRKSKSSRGSQLFDALEYVETTTQDDAPRASIDVISTGYYRRSTGHLGADKSVVKVDDGPQLMSDPQNSPLDNPFDDGEVIYNDAEVAEPEDPEESAKKRRAYTPLQDWLGERERFLSESLRSEANHADCCHSCRDKDSVAKYRCLDCDSMDVVCSKCILSLHNRNGLHQIEEWDDKLRFFGSTSLAALGHIYQLGHPIGESCPAPSASYNSQFTVLHTNGVHTVRLNFCNCTTSENQYIQLLRFGWFPFTVQFPRTAATFSMLKFYHILAFESKTTVFEFHKALRRITDNTGTAEVQNRYQDLLRVIRQYRNIKMLKRAARGHDPKGAQGTKPGECAVLCPACPYEYTLPEGWRDAPEHVKYLYQLFVGQDANFRLKRRRVSTREADPALSRGWAYFVEESDFKAFLDKYGKLIIQDPSTCNNHNAVNVNREHASEKYAATGTAVCDCIRHDMKRPLAACDLQKGERYINMDYIFIQSLSKSDASDIVVSYDINCQWSLKLWERVAMYPENLKLNADGSKTFRFLIPKFHLPAHIRACQTKYSFNYSPNVGRCDGEAPERGWVGSNDYAPSTKGMTEAARFETLDDYWADWNWRKGVRIAFQILRQIKEAVVEAREQTAIHGEFLRSLTGDSADLVNQGKIAEWSAQLDLWMKDHAQFNPLETTYKGILQSTVESQLATEEEEEAKKGTGFLKHETVSASQMILGGLELEKHQRRLAKDTKALGLHATEDQKTQIKFRMNAMRRKISAWINVQHLYMPAVYVHRQKLAEEADAKQQADLPVYSIPLFLPSSTPISVVCDSRLVEIEARMRVVECTDSLDDLRDALCLHAYVLIDKLRFQRGQHANTRKQAIVNRVVDKCNTAKITYQNAWAALKCLGTRSGGRSWTDGLMELKDEDVRPLQREETTAQANNPDLRRQNYLQVSEGRRTVSWIWTRLGGEGLSVNERLEESLRVEWCKSRARRDRWKEEVQLLVEEKRRILAFLQYRSEQWEAKAKDTGEWMLPGLSLDKAAVEGRLAYAREQANQFKKMREHCLKVWEKVDTYVAANGVGIKIKVPKREEAENIDGPLAGPIQDV